MRRRKNIYGRMQFLCETLVKVRNVGGYLMDLKKVFKLGTGFKAEILVIN